MDSDHFTRNDVDLEALRSRLARMSDADLPAYGKSAAHLVQNSYHPGRWIVYLREARAELQQRARHYTGHPFDDIREPHVPGEPTGGAVLKNE